MAKPVSKIDFGFEMRKLSKNDVRQLIYEEVLEYHPSIKQDYYSNNNTSSSSFVFPRFVCPAA